MASILEIITERVNEVDLGKYEGPKDPMGENERVVGIMSDHLRRLWICLEGQKSYQRACARRLESFGKKANESPEGTRYRKAALYATGELHILDILFLEETHREFSDTPLKDFANIAFRSDWRVVIKSPETIAE